MINEEGEDNRKEIAGLLYPEVDKKALTRQIFELVKYGKFTWTDVMNMPITSRRRYHFLLGRYNDREIAAAQKKPLPPIEVEDQVSSLNQMADKIRGDGGESKLSESSLPASVRAALKQMEEAEAAKPKTVSKKDKDEAKKKMVIRRKEDVKTESVLEEKEEKSEEKFEEKSITLEVIKKPEEKKENKIIKKEDSPNTLKEASDKLKAKYSKIGIPNELKALLSKKKL